MILIKRVYEPYEQTDGFRVLVDRLWPRGINKEHAQIDLWAKELTPSTYLRKWFCHDPEKFDDFKRRYLDELRENETVASFLEEIAPHKTVTLLYAAKDLEHNHALVLQYFLNMISSS